jgi:predicted MPP superfamily phosphohydrolase
MPVLTLILIFFAASQLYWGWRCYLLLTRRIAARNRRLLAMAAILAAWVILFEFNFGFLRTAGRFGHSTPVRMSLGQALFAAPFLWWTASSMVASLVALPFAIARAAAGRRSAERIESPSRRRFLQHAATAATAAPFVAGAYGLLYGRLNLETTVQPIRLPRLPAAFEGFRICQLSDIHIGPFMPAEEIRKYAAIANSLKADLMVLTGDFVTSDPTTQQAVVEALSGVRAPFGVYGCLGNHEAWCRAEDSIAALFQQTGVHMLRGANVPIATSGESINLIGVDFQSRNRFGPSAPVQRLLGNIEALISRDRVNILLSHNPDTFDRAAELGIEFSMAGHTHGGQAALEFISPQFAPSRLVTPYVAGLFQKPGGQLYVNRGLGTIGIPIRIGAPPEITVYTLTRG